MKPKIKNAKIGVVMGGLSAEREVSLDTGKGVLAALVERGYDAVAIDWTERAALPAQLAGAGIEVVWNALHGTYGEDGAVQGLLACLGIPGTGSGIQASALAIDKVASKRLFEYNGVPTPRWHVVSDDDDDDDQLLEFPCVVKPSMEGSSVGVSIVRDPAGIADAVALAARYHGQTIIEQFIAGPEVMVGIIDGAVIGDVEVRPARDFYDYEAKYKSGDTTYLVPAPLDDDIRQLCHRAALGAWRALGGSGHGRVDLRVSITGEPYVIEANTLPGMTATSLLPKIAAHADIDYATLCERILASAT